MADKDQANPEADSFLREVQEELREEQLAQAWKKYGNYVIGLAVAIVLLVGVREGWNYYDRTEREKFGERYFRAEQLIQKDDLGAAVAAYEKLAAESSGGRALLARLRAASTLATDGKHEDAARLFFQVADDSGIDQTYRDMANMLGALNGMNGGTGSDELKRRLQTLNGGTNPWRHDARELLALIAYRDGDTATARKILEELSKDATASARLRDRAEILISALSG